MGARKNFWPEPLLQFPQERQGRVILELSSLNNLALELLGCSLVAGTWPWDALWLGKYCPGCVS